MNLKVLEGVSKRFELQLQTVDGTPLPAAEWQLSGGAECSTGGRADVRVLQQTDGHAVLLLPPLPLGPSKVWKPQREPCFYQLRATERATGRVYVLLQGELMVEPWIGETEPAEGEEDARRTSAETALEDGEVVLGTVQVGSPGPVGPPGESGQLQPYHSGALPATLEAGHAYDLGTLAAATDLSALAAALPARADRVQTAELWFSLGDTAPAITWPQDAAWPEEPAALAPAALTTARAYRFALRLEPGGKLIICRAYEYSLANS